GQGLVHGLVALVVGEIAGHQQAGAVSAAAVAVKRPSHSKVIGARMRTASDQLHGERNGTPRPYQTSCRRDVAHLQRSADFSAHIPFETPAGTALGDATPRAERAELATATACRPEGGSRAPVRRRAIRPRDSGWRYRRSATSGGR